MKDERTKLERAIIRNLRRIAPHADITVDGDVITIRGYNPDRRTFTIEHMQHCITLADLPAFEAHCASIAKATYTLH